MSDDLTTGAAGDATQDAGGTAASPEETKNAQILDMVRRFAGADPAAADQVLEMCYLSAKAWYDAAGVPEDTENDLYNFWTANLAAWMYDNRGNSEANAQIPIYIISSVHQLRKKPSGGGETE